MAGHFLDMTPERGTSDFAEAWHRDGARVAAYARRHVPGGDVEDVVAETFLQAWRRWESVPRPPIAWLIGTARKVIGNQRRATRQRDALHERLERLDDAARSADDAGLLAADRLGALQALADLAASQREPLLLVAWDGLSPDDAASVLGVRPGTFRVRLHRARAALGSPPTSADRPPRPGVTTEGAAR